MATMLDLQNILTPPATRTWTPISHWDFASNVRRISDDLLVPKGYIFDNERITLAREGARMFGVFTYKNGESEMGLAIGIRNALDKSMALGLCLGATVFVCSNGIFSGEIVTMRRHTANIEQDIVPMILKAVYGVDDNFRKIMEMADRLKTVPCADRRGYEILGLLAGEGVLMPTVFNESMRQWKEPTFEQFQDRNAWSLYNAVTFGLKEAPAHKTFELHQSATGVFVTEFLPGGGIA